MQHSTDPNVIFTSVKIRVNDVVGGLPVQRMIKYNAFVAIKDIFVGEEITINKDYIVPGEIFENDNTLHDGSGFKNTTCPCCWTLRSYDLTTTHTVWNR